MELAKEAWINLLEAADIQNNALRNKCANLGYNAEVSAKNGGTETVISMITELESTLRVLKRRLIQTLPEEDRAIYNLSQAALVTAATETQELNQPIK